MKSHNKRKSGLLFEKVLKQQPTTFQPPRVEKPMIVDEASRARTENIARNIAKHNRQNAMIEAERARGLERQILEREFFKKNQQPVLIPVPESDSGIKMIKRNSATPFKLPHQSKAAPKQIVSSVGGSLVDNVKKTVSDYESQFDRPEFKEFVEKEKAAFGPGDEFGRMYAVVEPDGGYRLKDLSGEMEHIDIPEGMNYPESEKFLRDEARKNLQKRKGYFSDKAFMSNY